MWALPRSIIVGIATVAAVIGADGAQIVSRRQLVTIITVVFRVVPGRRASRPTKEAATLLKTLLLRITLF